MRKMLTMIVAVALGAAVLTGAALAARKTVSEQNKAAAAVQDTTAGLAGNTADLQAALQEPSPVKYKVLVINDTKGEDKTAYLDRVAEQSGWPETNMLLLVIYTQDNHDIRFAMGADLRQKNVTVEEMMGLVRSVYLPGARQGDPAAALALFIRAVNERVKDGPANGA